MDARHFSQCLQGRRVIMIGDSTMRQMFQSLACILGEHIQDGFLEVGVCLSPCAFWHALFQRSCLIDSGTLQQHRHM